MGTVKREFIKILFQKRSIIAWAGLFLLPVLMGVLFRLTHGSTGGGNGGNADAAGQVFEQIRSNGMLLVLGVLLGFSTFFLPLVSAMAGSNTIAGEAEHSTLRTVLMQPVRRGTLLMSKWVVANLYVAIGMLLLGLAALIVGGSLFGLHAINLFGTSGGLGHTILVTIASYAFVFYGMMAVVSMTVLFSTLTDSSLTAAAVSLVLIIIMLVLESFSQFAFLKPYLVTSHFQAFIGFFQAKMDWGPIIKGLINFTVWTVGTTGLAYWRFKTKDILS